MMTGQLLLLFALFTLATSVNILELNGKWLLKDEREEYNDLDVVVPGGIYTDLMQNNIIENIHFRFNDNVTRWVPRTNWTYYRNFTADDTLLSLENINIVFEGLDTISTIFLNDELIGRSQNMFVRYIFDIKNYLQLGENTIEVRFESPVEAAAKLAEKQPYLIPPSCQPDAYHGECHVNMLRKMQASFSWDWGPSFPSVGIWKNVSIEAYNETVLRYLMPEVLQKADKTGWVVMFNTYFANNTRQHVIGKLAYTIELPKENITRELDVDQSVNEAYEIIMTTSIEVANDKVKLWWPNGYGEQNLYKIHVRFVDKTGTEEDALTRTIGFRNVQLVQSTLAQGLSFNFVVNDIPIFMKGSNEIPIDILPELGQNPTTIKNLLNAAKEANMNMLRVWGGGVYESDYFYDLADENGIMIWQDFMFACALYPVDQEYKRSVLEEVRHQVKRLSGHACLALFAGNNENEGALADNWYNTADNFTKYKQDYIELYINTIQTEFNRLIKSRGIFVGSSPSNGVETVEEGYVAKHPGSSLYGDVHFYDYSLDSFNEPIFPTPRFASEYGYQSLPSIPTLLTATNHSGDLNISSEFMENRQHHPTGNDQLQLLMDYQLDLPASDSDNYFKTFIYYSQIIQAMSIKIETEHYRSSKMQLDDAGQGLTMGALYWQLNDVWVAPTWSSIDYTGKWKMLHYFAREFFAPIIITSRMSVSRKLDIVVVSDMTIQNNLTAVVKVFKWDSMEPVRTDMVELNIAPLAVSSVTYYNVDDYLSAIGCGAVAVARNNCFFHLSLESSGRRVWYENFALVDKLKHSNIQQPKLEVVSVTEVVPGQYFQITLKTDKIALFVLLDVPNIPGNFSANGFLLVEENRDVGFSAKEPVTLEDFKKDLTVTNLKDEMYS